MSSVQQFKPIYGWGWRQEGSAIEVPAPFELTVEVFNDAEISGIVREPHDFAGSTAVLSLRGQTDMTLNWGVVITGGRLAGSVTGFAQSEGVHA